MKRQDRIELEQQIALLVKRVTATERRLDRHKKSLLKIQRGMTAWQVGSLKDWVKYDDDAHDD